jgi:probable rRNA maturation factor
MKGKRGLLIPRSFFKDRKKRQAMEIQTRFQKKIPGLNGQTIKRLLKEAFKDLVNHDVELSILFTDDEHISQLNRHYLGRDGSTNVLAFPMSGGPEIDVDSGLLGDVVVSADTAIRESKDFGVPLNETIYRLLIHGILHLLNYDHEKSFEEALRMEKEEKRLLAIIMEEV